MNSMTGYGRAAKEDEGHRIEVSLRSVNHRFLDLAVRLREPYRSSEGVLRALLKERFDRGRVEVIVEITPLSEPALELRIRRRALTRLLDDLAELRPLLGERPEPTTGELLNLPEVLQVGGASDSWTDADEALLLSCAAEAAERLSSAREREGASLAESLRGTLEQLRSVTTEVRDRREQIEGRLLERVHSRLQQLMGEAAVDEGRLLQEAAHLAERSDVAEELDRLDAHCRAFAETVAASGPAGKRLEFLTQEIARELSTLAAKCNDLEISHLVVEARTCCERLREQVHNVE